MYACPLPFMCRTFLIEMIPASHEHSLSELLGGARKELALFHLQCFVRLIG